jgi:beta-xylosidase
VGVSGGGMVSTLDTPDPDVVYSGSGNKYYAYGSGTTNKETPNHLAWPAQWTTGGISVTPLYCSAGGCGVTGTAHVAMSPAIVPATLDIDYGLQAPAVAFIHGQWVMYYAELYAPSGRAYAIYYAASSSPTTGFHSSTTEAPLMYQRTTRGSTDPSVFIDSSGNPWLQWKSSTYTTNTHPLMANL